MHEFAIRAKEIDHKIGELIVDGLDDVQGRARGSLGIIENETDNPGRVGATQPSRGGGTWLAASLAVGLSVSLELC